MPPPHGARMTTGDQGVMDEEGYFTFVGRDDDVITSSGFRIGPAAAPVTVLGGHPEAGARPYARRAVENKGGCPHSCAATGECG